MPPAGSIIDQLLAEQQQLTAVERFARKHEEHDLPAQARYYRELMPLTRPKSGEQLAFAVDLDACTGCKACVSACHALNGLDEHETWRDVGLIHGGTPAEPYQQTITSACHHCADPACLSGCPVQAYEKDAETGIVRHLGDQCIGCQYCVMKCPYGVPKYSEKRGIVRKCDMCHGRLSAGEAPACVQACPNGAISIRIVEKAATAGSDRLLPGAFESSYTGPTTVYRSIRPIPENACAGDEHALILEPAHWPMIGMLTLTQGAVGLFVAAAALAIGDSAVFHAVKGALAIAGFVLLVLGLAASVPHLGRPLGAWRAFLGLRTSWMSREIVVFGIVSGAAAGLVGTALWEPVAGRVSAVSLVESGAYVANLSAPMAVATALLGLLAVYCSAMIYVDTRRAFWRRDLTFIKFFGTTLLLGAAGAAAVLAWGESSLGDATRVFAVLAVILRTVLFAWDARGTDAALFDRDDPNHRSARTVARLQYPVAIARLLLFVAATALGLFAIIATGVGGAVAATLVWLLTAVAQAAERYVFFTAVVALRMPGPPATAALHS